MNIPVRYFLYITLLLAPLTARAEIEIAGIELADSYQINDRSLTFSGAGVRSKFFIKVYVGALYLAKPAKDAAQALGTAGPKSMQMYILYKEVEAGKIAKGWSEGFQSNLSEMEYKQLESRLNQFNSLFPDLHKGDIVRMDYRPDKGTQLSINDKLLGNIAGEDFFTALMKVWIGDHPADSGLKKGLLGQ